MPAVNGAPPIQETLEEAASQQLGKKSKLETALDAILTNSFHKLDKDERDVVERYRNMKVFGDSSPRPQTDSGDFIVCDDMKIDIHVPKQDPPPAAPQLANGGGTLAKLGLGAALLATGVGSGIGSGIGGTLILDALRRPAVSPQAPNYQDTDTDTTTDIGFLPPLPPQ